MAKKEDLRVKRTKKLLSDAFLKLLSEKPFEAITINELCAVAGVRRATFYKHFTDKFTFLTFFTRSLRERFDSVVWDSAKPLNTPEYYVEYAKRIVTYIDENRAAIDNILRSDMLANVLAAIKEQNYIDTCEHLRISVEKGLKLPASVEVVAAICAGGVCEAIFHWIKSPDEKTVYELADEIGRAVSAIIGD